MTDINRLSKNTIRAFLKGKFGGNERSEANYCVGSSESVRFNEAYNNLVFGNDCLVRSLPSGDGVCVGKRFVKRVFIDNSGDIVILLKGSNSDYRGSVFYSDE